MNKSDHDLIADCLKGQTEAFGHLVLRYQDRLYNSLLGMLGSGEDARDAAQEAFIQAFQKLNTFGGRSAFYSWLFRIALNSFINQHRKRPRVSVSIEAVREQSGSEPSDPHPEALPEFSLERTERQSMVRTALSELSLEYRTVLVLKEMEGLSYEEIAEIVGCPIGTVRSRIHRARNELRTKLQIMLQRD